MDKDKILAKLLEKNERLEAELNSLKSQVKALDSRIEDDAAEIARWKDLYFSEKDRRYGRKSENKDIPNCLQLLLFDELENTVEGATEEADKDFTNKEDSQKKTKVRSYIRTKSKNATLTLPANSPVVDIYHDVEKSNCEYCGAELSDIGEFIEDKVTFVPSRYVVVRHHRKQQRCLNCLPDEGTNKIVTASLDKSLLGGTICEPSLLAYIITHKMQFGLPLYRLEQKLVFPDKQKISRQLMSSWSLLAYKQLKGLEEAFERNIKKAIMWNIDETSLINIHSEKKTKLLKEYEKEILKIQEDGFKKKLPEDDIAAMVEEKKDQYRKESPNARNCFMFVRSATNQDGSRGLVMYNYAENRTNDYIKEFIGDYNGIIQSDGLAGYASAAKDKSFIHLNCLIHARRPAKDVLRISPKNKIAKELVDMYDKIFKEEKEIRNAYKEGKYNADQYVKIRKIILEPLFEKLQNWLNEKKDNSIFSPKMKKAISYPIKRWNSLIKFMDYPFADSQNNEAERRIKNFVLGRKAFLFSNTILGANASAFYYSLVESCKALEIDVNTYLTHVLLNAEEAKTEEDWDNLLPMNVNLEETSKYLDKVATASANPERTESYILRGKKKR